MQASLKNYRQSPRKVRLVANLIKGKSVASALSILEHGPKRAGLPLLKLIQSAVANAKHNAGLNGELWVHDIRVEKGIVLMRRMPRARGRAFPIRKRTSHVLVVLGQGKKTTGKKAESERKASKKIKAE